MRLHMRRTELWLLAAILLLGLGLRIFSLSWNTFPHADVDGDATIGARFLQTGGLWDVTPDSTAPRQPSLFARDSREGIPTLQHGPVWILLGSGVSSLWHGNTPIDVYLALRILSVLCGTAMIAVLWKLARSLLDRESALVCALWAALSFLLIDYSGNGAFYALQGTLYLTWLLIALHRPSRGRAAALGAVTGVTYLVNYQSIMLLPAAIVLEFMQRENKKALVLQSGIVLASAALFASPWLIRNFILVGDPFAHHLVNSTYVFSKSGIHETVVDYVYRFPGKWEQLTAIFSMIVTSWLPNNSFYIARKLFVLAPVAFIFFSYGLIGQVLSKGRRNRLLPVLLLFVAHFLISASWPITKFRYFVPLLPLVFLLSLDALNFFVPNRRMRFLWMTLITVSIVCGSALTYFSVPTHTYYYDGAITTDPFSGRGEWNYLRDKNLLSVP
ncbi:MAG: glycosyltransferase family 39 protein [Candidatus Peribacteraceae bacterium]|nr:glycosyltransferase family 39 protein [Candidatus Peribacteraceae bacterium]MDD5742205.1 glycosyltransferase family 39 protein [Candidatus Peribacteraceae bacterium]